MKNRISINGRNGTFGAHVARPEALPAPAVVVLHEVFGVNADIRKTCDELAEQGFIAVAPDLFWRQVFKVNYFFRWRQLELPPYAASRGCEFNSLVRPLRCEAASAR